MKRLHIYAFVLIWSSCEMVIDMPIAEEPPKITLNLIATADSTIKVNLHKSQHVLEDKPFSPIVNGDVTIRVGDRDFPLEYAAERIYSGELRAVAGSEYQVFVSAPGFENVSAEFRVPDKPEIAEIEVDSNYSIAPDFYNERREYRAAITFLDPPGRNYYELRMLMIDTINYYPPGEDTAFTYINKYPVFFTSLDPAVEDRDNVVESANFTDDLFDGQRYTFDFSFGIYRYDDPNSEFSDHVLEIELSTLDENLYQYIISTNLQSSNRGNPFAQPVQVINNIRGGFGIAAGRSQEIAVAYIKR